MNTDFPEGIPNDENPEWTAADFARARHGAPWADGNLALARKRDGSLENPRAFARHMLRETRTELERTRGDERRAIEEALEHIRVAFASACPDKALIAQLARSLAAPGNRKPQAP